MRQIDSNHVTLQNLVRIPSQKHIVSSCLVCARWSQNEEEVEDLPQIITEDV